MSNTYDSGYEDYQELGLSAHQPPSEEAVRLRDLRVLQPERYARRATVQDLVNVLLGEGGEIVERCTVHGQLLWAEGGQSCMSRAAGAALGACRMVEMVLAPVQGSET